MKKFIYLSIIVLSAGLLTSAALPDKNPSEVGIQFFKGSWKAALAKAKKENKLIFLDANASWCRPCKLMEKRTFSDVAVGKFYNERFINVKMDMEKGEGIELSKKLGIRAYPTLFFIDGKGNVVKKSVGYLGTEDFLKLGKGVVGNK